MRMVESSDRCKNYHLLRSMPGERRSATMRIDQYCKRAVVAIGGRSDIAEAAQLMRDRHVGFLVVFDESDHLRRPIGVLTDRDIVLEVTALDVDPHAVTVRDIMTRQ